MNTSRQYLVFLSSSHIKKTVQPSQSDWDSPDIAWKIPILTSFWIYFSNKFLWHLTEYTQVLNIWKPYMSTAEWRIKWRIIIATLYTQLLQNLRKDSLIQTCMGFEPLTSVILIKNRAKYKIKLRTCMQSCKHENKHNITTLEITFQNIKFFKFSGAAIWPLPSF